ncbi:RNA recognition motif domain-containing protein [Ditylenchus destructor]|nr:RNA recognition motif domain-containing protein [Ditylenchus destructor]
MLNLRSAVQRCVRRASIVGSSPLRHHTSRNNSNVIYVSRQTFADANVELVENASQHSGIKHLSKMPEINSKSSQDIANDQEANRLSSITDTKSSSDIANDPEADSAQSIADVQPPLVTANDVELQFVQKKHFQVQMPALNDNKSAQDTANDPETGGTVSVSDNQTSQDTASHPTVEASQSTDSKGLNPAQDSKNLESNGNSEVAENASISAEKDGTEVQTTAVTDNKQLPDMANDPEAKETTSITDTKSLPDIVNDPEAEAIPSFSESSHPRDKKAQESKNLDFRRYHIFVRGFSVAIKRDMLQKFYSQFGKLIRCMTYKNEQGMSDAMVVFGSKKGMHRALKSPRHRINGEEVIAEIGTHKTQLNLRVQDLSPETTEESLRDFYSKFGNLTQCVLAKDPETGKAKIGYVSFASHEELDRALDAQPHLVDGSEVFLRYSTDELNLIVKEVPEGITEESLNTFFSQYGQVRRCEWIKGNTGITHAFLSFSTLDEVNRAMEHRPHIIDRKLLKTDFPRRQGLYTIFVGSLPENATGVSLFKAFSPFGKIVHLEVRNDTGRNRRGGFGFVSYGTWQEADNALNAGPHEVEGVTVDNVPVNDAKHCREESNDWMSLMLSLRGALQRSVWNASILGGHPLCLQIPGSSSVICVLRQAHSKVLEEDQKSEEAENASMNRQILRFAEALGMPIPPDIANDPGAKATSSNADRKALNSTQKPRRAYSKVQKSKETGSASMDEQILRFSEALGMPIPPDITNDPGTNATSSNANRKALDTSVDGQLLRFAEALGMPIPPDIANDPGAKATSSNADSKVLNSTQKPRPSYSKASKALKNDPHKINGKTAHVGRPTIADSKALNATQNLNNLTFRKYHILVRGFSGAMTEDMLREFYSKFGQLISCRIVHDIRHKSPVAYVVFSYKKSMNHALRSMPHIINDEKVYAKVGTSEHELKLRLLNLSPETTEESLREFYSRFGKLIQCEVNKNSETGESEIGYVSFGSHEDLDRALDAQPHFIDGSEVFLKYASGELDLGVKDVPEGITEESLRTFFSKYGHLRQCQLIPIVTGKTNAILSFSTINAVNRAMDDRPHIIDNKILRTDFFGKRGLFHIFVGSLPESATLESLFDGFSKFGKIVHLEILNDGGMNQRGPYGFVSYGTWEEMKTALKNGPHTVDGVTVQVGRPAIADGKALNVPQSSKNLELRKYLIKPPPDMVNDRESNQTSSIADSKALNKSQSLTNNEIPSTAHNKPLPETVNCPEALDMTQNLNYLSLRKYHILVRGFSKAMTDDMLREFYSKFGQVINCRIMDVKRFQDAHGIQQAHAHVVFSSKESMNHALKSVPHIINNEKVYAKVGTSEYELKLRLLNLSPETTEESLREFYSRFGKLIQCEVKNNSETGESKIGIVAFGSHEDVNRALDDRPHIIDNNILRTDSGRKHGLFPVFVGSLPENVTLVSLFKEFSRFGKIVHLDVRNDGKMNQRGPYGFVSYGTKEEMYKALRNGSHTVDGATVHVGRPPFADGKALNDSQSGTNNEAPWTAHNEPLSETVNSPKTLDAESKALDMTQNPNNLSLRKYHILVREFSKAMTENMLREFYSKFGQVIRCKIRDGEHYQEPHAYVVFNSKESMNRAMKSVPHFINDEKVYVKVGTNKDELKLRLLNLSPETTEESLREFYSRFGSITDCDVRRSSERGESKIGHVAFGSHEELDRALDAQPHLIDGSQVFLDYATGDLDLLVKEVPEGITEELLRAFFSKYGQLRRCECFMSEKFGKIQAYVSFSAIDEVNRAMEDRPHVIHQKILRTEFRNKSGSFSLFVGSLPENANLVSLFKAFSKFGKIVHLEMRNDGDLNQSGRGPYGFVTYGTKEEAHNALNTRPYMVDGSVVFVRIASMMIDESNKQKSSTRIAFE